MASTILETMRNVEVGRQNCIKNARLANLEPTDDMDIFNIGELFLQKNTEEYIDPSETVWERPSDWWDTKTILEEAEDKDGLHPAYILLLRDDDDTTTFTKTTTGKALQGDGYLTSDGSWYTTDGATHTWDKTQDKPCSLGYKTRYVIVYVANTTSIGAIDLRKFLCLEMIIGAITIPNGGLTFGSSSFDNRNWIVENIEATENTIFNTLGNSYDLSYLNNIRHIYLPLTGYPSFSNNSKLLDLDLPNLTNISSQFAQHCYSLQRVNLPSVTACAGNDAAFTNCYSLRTLNLPNVTRFGSNNGFQNCWNLTSITAPLLALTDRYNTFRNMTRIQTMYFPALTQNTGGSNFANNPNLTTLLLPSLITNTGGTMCENNYKLTEISIPNVTRLSTGDFRNCWSLKTISIPLVTYIADNVFKDCHSLESVTLPSILQTFNTTDVFTNCYNLRELNLFQGFKFSGLNLSTCVNLKYESLNDILDNLADVTSESSTYTLTLGATNLAKLTAQEIAVGTDKGWVIS